MSHDNYRRPTGATAAAGTDPSAREQQDSYLHPFVEADGRTIVASSSHTRRGLLNAGHAAHGA